MPDARIIVDESAGWEKRTLESAIEAGKKRKKDEGGDGWNSEDEIVCMRREQWRMMRALGMETQESEPSKPSSTVRLSASLLMYTSPYSLVPRWRPRARA